MNLSDGTDHAKDEPITCICIRVYACTDACAHTAGNMSGNRGWQIYFASGTEKNKHKTYLNRLKVEIQTTDFVAKK